MIVKYTTYYDKYWVAQVRFINSQTESGNGFVSCDDDKIILFIKLFTGWGTRANLREWGLDKAEIKLPKN